MIEKHFLRQTAMAVLALWPFLWLPMTAKAEVKLPALFGDRMVLQQKSEAAIWGWADPGEEVTVTGSWNGRSCSATADATGKWRVRLPTPSAGGPYRLTFQGRNEIVLEDLLIGEVWLCSGQSNMEMSLSMYGGVVNSSEEIARAHYPQIRLFTVQNSCTAVPQADCRGSWSSCTPHSASTFSATGYFFGRKIHETLNVPLGLISADWGGTPAESWTAEETIRSFPEFTEALAQLELIRSGAEQADQAYEKALGEWWRKLEILDKDRDDHSWSSMNLPTTWDVTGLGKFEGVVWFRKEVEIPSAWKDLDLILDLGPIDESDTTWVNGVRVGERLGADQWQVKRTYPVPAAALRPGTNVISVRVLNTSGAGGIYGKEEALRLRPAESASTSEIPLAGPWQYRRSCACKDLDPLPEKPGINTHTPTTLYNGMIAPLVPFTLRGTIWYQGESNRRQGLLYRRLFPALINCWRTAWGQGDFPFYFVQIAPFRYDEPLGAALLREAQFMALSLKNTGMVVTTDIGNPMDIHPKNKQEVGRRLALWALARDYGKEDLVHSGPLYRSMHREGDKIRIFFDHLGGGLMVRGGPLSHFQIAGADQQFYPAQAIIDGETILVYRKGLQQPVAVRFGWCNVPEANLFNAEGLPASPFRSLR